MPCGSNMISADVRMDLKEKPAAVPSPSARNDGLKVPLGGTNAATQRVPSSVADEPPRMMLEKLLALFPGESLHSDIAFEETPAERLLPRYHHLLNHTEHLTKVLQDLHGGLDVKVMESDCRGDIYARRTLLVAPSGSPVGYAIIVVDLTKLPPAVKKGIEGEVIPFGQLLMDHVHTRCVKLNACWKVQIGKDLEQLLGIGAQQAGVTFARTIVIQCDGQDAAEVLEIVV